MSLVISKPNFVCTTIEMLVMYKIIIDLDEYFWYVSVYLYLYIKSAIVVCVFVCLFVCLRVPRLRVPES